ncbi:MAG TPA: universal stress protein [Gemmatimonadales bacterium]
MKLEMILAATNGSPVGNDALRAAARIAAGAGARLAAVTVAQDPRQWIESGEVEKYRFNLPDPIESVLTPRVRDRLEPVFRAAIDTPLTAHLVRLGVPGVEVARAAEIVKADLVVLGRGAEIGRTIEATIRRARMPCLLVPAGPLRFQRVLAAVGAGPAATDVLAGAVALAVAEGGDILALHVEPTPGQSEGGAPRRETIRHVHALSGALHAAWEREAGGAPTATAACELIVRQGELVTEILNAVREERIDLLVVGCHRGESGDQLKSIGFRLLRRAPCAVLTVPV